MIAAQTMPTGNAPVPNTANGEHKRLYNFVSYKMSSDILSFPFLKVHDGSKIHYTSSIYYYPVVSGKMFHNVKLHKMLQNVLT